MSSEPQPRPAEAEPLAEPAPAVAAGPGPPRDRWDRAADWAWGMIRRIHLGTRRPANWVQLVQFGTVGGTGYIVNLAVFALLNQLAGVHHLAAATGAFAVAVSNNFLLNRHWTFRRQGATAGRAGFQAPRFFTVSVIGLLVNLAVLALLVDGVGLRELPGQAIAVAVAMPVNFIGNKLWTFGVERPD